MKYTVYPSIGNYLKNQENLEFTTPFKVWFV